jgi:hypothetical protein
MTLITPGARFLARIILPLSGGFAVLAFFLNTSIADRFGYTVSTRTVLLSCMISLPLYTILYVLSTHLHRRQAAARGARLFKHLAAASRVTLEPYAWQKISMTT